MFEFVKCTSFSAVILELFRFNRAMTTREPTFPHAGLQCTKQYSSASPGSEQLMKPDATEQCALSPRTRSKSTPTAAQLEHKREHDRNAQRASRQMTKAHIERLETTVSELRRSHQASEQAVLATQQHNRELEEENTHLQMSSANSGLSKRCHHTIGLRSFVQNRDSDLEVKEAARSMLDTSSCLGSGCSRKLSRCFSGDVGDFAFGGSSLHNSADLRLPQGMLMSCAFIDGAATWRGWTEPAWLGRRVLPQAYQDHFMLQGTSPILLSRLVRAAASEIISIAKTRI